MDSKSNSDPLSHARPEEVDSRSASPIAPILLSTAASLETKHADNDDATLAQMYHRIEQLTSLFQFSPSLARRAIEAVGCTNDVTAAYNWILDEGLAEDKGGPIVPKTDCPHVGFHVKVRPEDIMIRNVCGYHVEEGKGVDIPYNFTQLADAKSEVYEKDGVGCPPGENWICLECSAIRCSRYVNGHCKAHWERTKRNVLRCHNEDINITGADVGHCIAASLVDLSIWCYECNAYLAHPDLNKILERLQQLKFGEASEV